jgi:hypothetical protein
MNELNKVKRNAAYTLTELGIVAGTFAVVGGTIYVLMTAGLNLFAKNHAVNKSSEMVRGTLDRMTRDLHAAIEPPALIDSSGATVPVTGSTPVAAAGVKFRMFIAGPVRIPSAASASATSVALAIQSSDKRPTVGQFLVIPASTLNVLPQDVYARISSVGGGPTTPTLGLTGTLGSFLTPPAATGTVAPANTIAHIVQEAAYVVTTPQPPARQIPELRFYPRAMRIATDGATAFHSPANYSVVTPNMVATPTPFRRAYGDRALSVQFTAEDSRYSNRFNSSFAKSLSIGTDTKPHTIPYKSLGL